MNYLLFASILLTASTDPATAQEKPRQSSSPPTHVIALHNRQFSPVAGIDPTLLSAAKKASRAGASDFHCLVQYPEMVAPAQWEALAKKGIVVSAYLGERNWVVRVPLGKNVEASLKAAFRALSPVALTTLLPTDKSISGLRERIDAPGANRPARLAILFFPTSDPAREAKLVRALSGITSDINPISPHSWSIALPPWNAMDVRALDALLAYDGLHFVDEELPMLPTMDVTRAQVGADLVQRPFVSAWPLPVYLGYTGRGVTLSNGEGLAPNHDDFWNHNLGGARTLRRFDLSQGGGSGHGTMTAGIMLGNGWRSQTNGGTMWQWRGIAPNAYLASKNSGESAENKSYLYSVTGQYDSFMATDDQNVFGNGGNLTYHPIVTAVANNGQHPQYGNRVGYYSVLAPSKNDIVVGNLNMGDLSWAGSSMGPTFDGRIKPDISAPGTNRSWPAGRLQPIPFAVDEIAVKRADNTIVQQWNFNASSSNWAGGWGQNYSGSTFFTLQEMTQPTQVAGSPGSALSTNLTAPPWNQWDNSPMIGTGTDANGNNLAILAMPGDYITLKYRLGPEPYWSHIRPAIGFAPSVNYVGVAGDYVKFDRPTPASTDLADGQWHIAIIPVASSAKWVGTIKYIDIRLRDLGTGMMTTSADGAVSAPSGQYFGSGGSSASSPVVTGALGLLLEQVENQFGVVLGSHVNSPFFATPGNGVPMSSTWKALLLHTAIDLASIPVANDESNIDTGTPIIYYKGPDFTTGYGNLDVGAASRILSAQSINPTAGYVREDQVANTLQPKTYTFTVPPGQTDPVRITLAWDDLPGSPVSGPTVPKLVNDLDLKVTGPGNVTHFPWTLDQPYPGAANLVEPQTINPANIKPARRDVADRLNNVEQVYAELPAPGVWTVTVQPYQLALNLPKYSLVIGGPPSPAASLTVGKVVFSSDRTGQRQLYVKQVASASAPVQITNSPFTPHHPAWSPDGNHIAYIDKTVVLCCGGQPIDALTFSNGSGAFQGAIIGAQIGGSSLDNLGYPKWSPDGKKLVITVAPNGVWGARYLKLIEFAAPYNFNTYTATTVVPTGVGAAEADFSPDGKYLYYTSDASGPSALWRIAVAGGAPLLVYANAAPIKRGFAVSVSPDGRKILYNSELWKDDPVTNLDEELLQADLITGVGIPMTREPGNQYGRYVKRGKGEYVMQSNVTPNGKTDIFLATNNARVKLPIGDPTNIYDDGEPDWWK